MDLDKAKEVLKEHGYNVDNLWSINDVKSEFDCTDEQAQEVLSRSLKDGTLTADIYGLIDDNGSSMGLQRITEKTY